MMTKGKRAVNEDHWAARETGTPKSNINTPTWIMKLSFRGFSAVIPLAAWERYINTLRSAVSST